MIFIKSKRGTSGIGVTQFEKAFNEELQQDKKYTFGSKNRWKIINDSICNSNADDIWHVSAGKSCNNLSYASNSHDRTFLAYYNIDELERCVFVF